MTTKSIMSDTFKTPPGRLSYPHLYERNEKGTYPSGRYETIHLIPKSENMDYFFAIITKTMKEAFGDKYKTIADLKDPCVRDGDVMYKEKFDPETPEKNEELKGNWYIKVKTDNKPQVVSANPKVPADPNEVYGGQWAKLSLHAYSYDKGASKKGISLSLHNVQIIGGGAKFGLGNGDPVTQFEAEQAVTAQEALDDDINF